MEKYLSFNGDECFEEIKSICKEHCSRYGINSRDIDTCSCEGAANTMIELVGMLCLAVDPKNKELHRNKELIDRLKLLYIMVWTGYPFNDLSWSNKEYKEYLCKEDKNEEDIEDMKQIRKEIKDLKNKLIKVVKKW
jgi:hypothetical protein